MSINRSFFFKLIIALPLVLAIALCEPAHAASVQNYYLSIDGRDFRPNATINARVHFEIQGKFTANLPARVASARNAAGVTIKYEVQLWEDIKWGRDRRLITRTGSFMAVTKYDLDRQRSITELYRIRASELGTGGHDIYAILTVTYLCTPGRVWRNAANNRETSRTYIAVR